MKIKSILQFIGLSAGIFLMNSCSSDEEGNYIGVPAKDLTTHLDLNGSEKNAMNALDDFNHHLMMEMASQSEDGEFCVSPVSLSICLSMLANSTDGNCQDQILNALGTKDLSYLNSLNQKLMRYLPNDDNGSSINVANHVWISKKYHAKDAYANTLGKWYYAGIDYVDFSKKSSISNINNWVSDNTKGKISNFFEESALDYSQMEMVLGNAVYFKGDWEYRFGKSDTTTEIFHSPSGDKQVSMMHKVRNMFHSYNDKLQSVALWFEDCKNTMYLYLPDPGVDIAECLEILTPEEQERLRWSGEQYRVTLSLPKFEAQSKCEMDNLLTGLGIDGLAAADLAPMGINGERRVKILNQSSLKIDEDGAELAAFTPATGLYSFTPPRDADELTVTFDRPFIYIIRNSVSHAILMAGAVTNP